ncbi:hypothetical protein [Stutzerimonas nitrititolerans]|uniref:hypothetical protein n=1 Tax=Stutzerimonas nitrititolerans TaxID=2482751 RepID=UPI00289F356C|nr:hypothetical protein [Stutzerimonas nitrititolerans]
MLEALFLATAKAAPAATASASAGYDWKWLVPVATLILGFGLKWLQDYVTEKGRRNHEKQLRREQRFDLLRSRRIDAERANLLALQPLVGNLMRAVAVGYLEDLRCYRAQGGKSWGNNRLPPEADEAIRRANADLVPLRARVHTSDVSVALNELVDLLSGLVLVKSEREATEIWRTGGAMHDVLQELIGKHIKALEDENQVLVDPPVR